MKRCTAVQTVVANQHAHLLSHVMGFGNSCSMSKFGHLQPAPACTRLLLCINKYAYPVDLQQARVCFLPCVVLHCRVRTFTCQLCGGNCVSYQDAWFVPNACHDRGACSASLGASVAECQARIREVHRSCHSSLLPFHLESVLFRISSAPLPVMMIKQTLALCSLVLN